MIFKTNKLYINAGAMKAGTTWLQAVLNSNNNIAVTPVKEIDYFSQIYTPYKLINFDMRKRRASKIVNGINTGAKYDEIRDLMIWIADYLVPELNDDWYFGLFKNYKNVEYYADLSNTYCHLPREGWEHVAELKIPTKVTMILRDPVDRALSHIKFEYQFNGRLDDFKRLSDDELIQQLTRPDVFERSDYTQTMTKIQEFFPNSSKFFIFENIVRNPNEFVYELSELLSVRLQLTSRAQQKINVGPSHEFSSTLLTEMRRIYGPLYAAYEETFGGLPEAWKQS